MDKNNHSLFVTLFSVISMIFLWELIAMRGIFIGGDNIVQFYPWFKAYAGSIKNLQFPFWSRYMQSGFPLMAEGQVGGYYPFNILFFFLLPFNLAYNYSIVFHFILGGVSIYLLSRKIGSCEWGGLVSAVLFCFGSAFAGCFYNIITLRALSWTPLVFLLFEYYFDKKRLSYMLVAAVIFGFQFLAGFTQVALYSGLFYLIYFVYRLELLKERLQRHIVVFTGFCIIASLLFLPQLILTSKLVSYSSRSGSDLGFALWGSFNPIGLLGAVFPFWADFIRDDFYFSIIAILFLISSFYLIKKDKAIRPIFLIMCVSFFFALGRYNPLYVGMLKITRFYIFRNPAKFIFFTALSASLLAGRGFSEFFGKDFHYREKALRLYLKTLLICGGLFFASIAVLRLFKRQILSFGRWYVEKMVYGRAYHKYDLNTYLDKIEGFYKMILKYTSISNIFNIVSWVFILIALVGCWYILKHKKRTDYSYLRPIAFSLIVADLFIYSFIGVGFRGNIEPFDRLIPTHQKIFEYIKADKALFRVLPYNIASKRLPSWILPNANMVYAIDSAAAYTPLANRYYQKALDGLEVVDNSLGVLAPAEDSLARNLDLIRLLNVKYLISPEKLKNPFLRFILEEDGARLYLLKSYLPRAFILRDGLKKNRIDRSVKVEILDYRSGKALFKVEMPYKGFLAFSENNYPGWEVYIDGRRETIVGLGLIQAVEVNKGVHTIKFIYKPYSFKWREHA